uniref:Uncharacterized protein n=1 Tax=Leptobrachium leishanense TaxID=445787 RepID=A0A8C5Q2T4_9ANUR
MTQSTLKSYPRDVFDQNKLQETLFSPFVDFDLYEELVLYPIRQLLKVSDRTTGDSLTDFSLTDVFQIELFTNSFNNINILRASDSSIEDVKKWMKKEKAASVTSQIVAALVVGSSDWKEKVESLRKKNPKVLKWNTEKGNPTKPFELKEADCFLSLFVLDFISKTPEDFHSNILKIASMLGVGKRFFLCGLLNCTRFTVGDELYHVLPYDDHMVREALLKAGIFVISMEMKESKVKSDAVKYDYIYFVDAIKFSE